jgi:transposase
VLTDKSDVVLGFLDESSPRSGVNTVRLWSYEKPSIVKNSNMLHCNTIGFYTLNGESVVDFKKDSKAASICAFLELVRNANPDKELVMVLDNSRAHRGAEVAKTAMEQEIGLVFLPPYSPDLNPIEMIWKSVKRALSPHLFKYRYEMMVLIRETFLKLAQSASYAKEWKTKILGDLEQQLYKKKQK